MISWLLLVFRTLSGVARSRVSLSAENAVLRHQLAVLQRERPGPLLRPTDRVLWIWLCRYWRRWRSALVLIQPATVFKRHWDLISVRSVVRVYPAPQASGRPRGLIQGSAVRAGQPASAGPWGPNWDPKLPETGRV